MIQSRKQIKSWLDVSQYQPGAWALLYYFHFLQLYPPSLLHRRQILDFHYICLTLQLSTPGTTLALSIKILLRKGSKVFYPAVQPNAVKAKAVKSFRINIFVQFTDSSSTSPCNKLDHFFYIISYRCPRRSSAQNPQEIFAVSPPHI